MLIKIKSVRSVENEPLVAVSVELCHGERRECKRLVVPIDFCRENGISRGISDENTYIALCDAAKLCEAVRRGESILAFSQNSKSALKSKLIRRGIEKDTAEKAVEALAEKGFIDDRENALAEAERSVKKLWGAKRIMNHLAQKGYRGAALENARAYLEDVDFISGCCALINKKYPGALSDERSEKDRAVAGLIRYGYSFSQVRAAIGRLGGECDDFYD